MSTYNNRKTLTKMIRLDTNAYFMYR